MRGELLDKVIEAYKSDAMFTDSVDWLYREYVSDKMDLAKTLIMVSTSFIKHVAHSKGLKLSDEEAAFIGEQLGAMAMGSLDLLLETKDIMGRFANKRRKAQNPI